MSALKYKLRIGVGMRGVRMEKLVGFLEQPYVAFHISLVIVALAPLRYFGAWLFKHCQGESDREIPHICDLTNDEYSPVTIVMQFYSAILMVTNAWQCFWRRLVGNDAWTSTMHNHVRRLVAHSAAQTHRRHCYRFASLPFRAARLVDPRLPYATRCDEAHKLHKMYEKQMGQ